MNDQIKAQLSAFVDGELSDAESELLIRRISRDPGLREQIAEYQALGRVMRNEYSVRLDGLLHRIKAGIDAPDVRPVQAPPPERGWRPLAGLATAAAVALVAIVGAGQFAGTPEAPLASQEQYTVPPVDMREYYQRHGETASGFNTRVVTLQMREEALDEQPSEDDEDKQDKEETSAGQ